MIQKFFGWLHPQPQAHGVVRPWVVVLVWLEDGRISAIGPFSSAAAKVYAQARNQAARDAYIAVPVEVALTPPEWPE